MRDKQHQSFRIDRHDRWALLVLAAFTLIVRGGWFGDPNSDVDEQLYSLIGNAMLEGKLPVVDLWDRKPFGLFALFAFAHWLGGPGPAAYQVLGTAFTFAGATMTVALARNFVDRTTSVVAGILYVVLMTTYGAFSGNSEVFHVPMMVAMANLVWDGNHPQARSRALAAMLIGGIALQVKYTVLPQCLFFGFWALWSHYRGGARPIWLVNRAVVFGLLGILPTAIVAIGYASAGYWDEFVFANFHSFFERLPSSVGRIDTYRAATMLPMVVLILMGANAARRRPSKILIDYLFFGLWFAAALITVFLPSTLYFYYLAALVPPCTLLAMPLFSPEGGKRISPISILPGAMFLLLLPLHYNAAHESRSTTARLANAIAPHIDARSGRCLWVFDGPTSLYRMTESCLPTRFIYPDHLNNALERDALGINQEDEVARILATRPPVIVTADIPLTPQNPEALSRVNAAIAQHYRPLTHEVLRKRTIRAWVLRR